MGPQLFNPPVLLQHDVLTLDFESSDFVQRTALGSQLRLRDGLEVLVLSSRGSPKVLPSVLGTSVLGTKISANLKPHLGNLSFRNLPKPEFKVQGSRWIRA